MRELGRKGGKASVRSRLGLDVDADVTLQEKARRRLEAQLDSDDERLAQAAARALYSYGPAKPPADADERNSLQDMPHRGVTIAKVLEVAVFEAQGMVDNELAGMILRSAAKVRELQAAGKLSPNFVDQLEEEAVERFTAGIERLADRKQNDVPSDLASLERKRAEESLSHPEDDLAELERLAWRRGGVRRALYLLGARARGRVPKP
jgi:hypothetical protein